MFGESESESPRVGSPWDILLASSASTSGAGTPPSLSETESSFKRVITAHSEMPKLIPEVEAGNVEYKLQLLDPTPERFLRLVTQLKWRLLEGGGQAYYELGVADSGALIGLEKSKMDKTLGTLEAMAGEIGASVVVVREIEVPASLSEAARLLDSSPNNSVYDVLAKLRPSGSVANPRTRPTEWGALEVLRPNSNGDLTASESETDISSINTTDESSAAPSPASRSPQTAATVPDDGDEMFAFDLEISSVYKPVLPIPSDAPRSWEESHEKNGAHLTKKGTKTKPKMKKLEMGPKATEDKKVFKRQKRDAGRERRKYQTVPSSAPTATADADAGDSLPSSLSPTDQIAQDLAATVTALEKLHIPLAEDDSIPVNITVEPPEDTGKEEEEKKEPEKRVIVEALVVRKLSTEEAFLDFGGFDLGD